MHYEGNNVMEGGNPYQILGAPTWEVCMKKCQEHSRCKGWTWVSLGGDGTVVDGKTIKHKTCMLKTVAGGDSRKWLKGFHSGTAYCEGKRERLEILFFISLLGLIVQ